MWRRRLFTAVSAVSLVLCLAVLIAWARTRWALDRVTANARGFYVTIGSDRGCLLVVVGSYPLGLLARLHRDRSPVLPGGSLGTNLGWAKPPPGPLWSHAWAGTSVWEHPILRPVRPGPGVPQWIPSEAGIRVPDPLLAGLLVALPEWAVVRRRRGGPVGFAVS